MTLAQICDWIVLVGAVAVAIVNIAKLLGHPIKFFKRRQEKEFHEHFSKELETEIPKILNNHEAQVASTVSKSVAEEMKPQMQEIRDLNKELNRKIDIMTQSTRDLLRDRIISLYNQGKETRSFSDTDKELLEDLYSDYKAEDGNGYIKIIYTRMQKWNVDYNDSKEDV